MNTADGTITIGTKVDTRGMKSGLSSISKSLKGITGLVAKAFAIGTLIKFGKEAIELASDLNEVQNVVDTAFGDMAYKIEDFSKTCVENFGMSELSAKQLASTFMAMGTAMGQARDIGSDMAVELTGRLGDIASFYNKDMSRLATIGRAIYSGETEPLKDLGVIMTEDMLSAYALSKGYATLYKQMSASQKLLVRQQYFLEQTNLAAGDFVKTQDSWANQTRILAENWKVFLSVLGSGLITIFTPLLKILNQVLVSLISIARAISNVISSLFGLKRQTASTSSGAQQLSTAEDNVATSIGGASKAAKRSLATFDELNNIQGDTGAGGADGGLGDISADIPEAVEDTYELSEIWQKIIDYLKHLGELFKAGFLDGLGRAEEYLERIKQYLESIKQSLIYIGERIKEPFLNMIDKIVYALGQMAGAFTSIGITIATNLIGGIAKYLDKYKDFISGKLISIFGSIGDTFSQAGNFAAVVAEIFSVFGDENAVNITSDLISIFANTFLEIIDLAWKFINDFTKLITQPIMDNSEDIRAFFDGLLGDIATITDGISSATDDIIVALDGLYDQHIRPLFEDITESVSSGMSVFLTAYETYVKPFVDKISQNLGQLFSTHIGPAISQIVGFVGSVIDAIRALWDFLRPFVEWLIEAFTAYVLPIIIDTFNNIVTYIGNLITIIGDIFAILGDLIDFVVNVLTGDWPAAWEAANKTVEDFTKLMSDSWGAFCDFISDSLDTAWTVMKGIINIIISGFETLVNAIIDAINGIVEGLNSIEFTVPPWIPGVGGQQMKFGLEPLAKLTLPRLAQGAVIPPNKEFMAILGDQKSGTNIEAPLDTIKQALAETLAELGMINKNEDTGDIIIQIDGREIFRVVREQNDIFTESTGYSAF